MNKCILIGNLTKDPELNQTTNDISVCKFTIGVSRKFQNANGERETDFLPIITWRGQADNCAKFLRKGSKVAICGSIQTRSYEANDGSKRYITEIVADEVQFLDSKRDDEEEQPKQKANERPGRVTDMKPIDDAELPF